MPAVEACAFQQDPFGTMPDGRPVTRWTLTNRNGIMLKVIDLGGIITELHTPDRNGKLGDIVLGYDSVAAYLGSTAYFGALIGRYANRIRNGKLSVDGNALQLLVNDGPHHLHGGPTGFDKVMWTCQRFTEDGCQGLALSYRSADGEMGYPGNVDIAVRYLLNDDNELVIDYSAVTDAATPINLTQHSYFNLAGNPSILGHQLQINADAFTPIDAGSIPRTMATPVQGTPFDFRSMRAIGACIDQNDEQLANGKGYDHNFVLNKDAFGALSVAARVEDAASGRALTVLTTEPGIQFYSGNFLDGRDGGKGRTYGHRGGLCLEPQHYPDSPNRPDFPNTILRPGERYATNTKYVFSSDALAARQPDP